jgi:ABC-type branched-subunit amino acid transport system substrate-binding protein
MLGSATGVPMFLFVPVCIADSDTLQIAVIGPMSGKDHEGGQAMLDGVNLYVEEVNKSGGINGRALEVIAYDDQNNKVTARNRALEIAKESKTLVVIGHYYSSISLEGGKIYKEYGIPAITASATAPEVTEGNGWYFRVVPDTNLQGKFSALYIKNILEHEAANIVFEQSIAYRIFPGTGSCPMVANWVSIRIRSFSGVVSSSIKQIWLPLSFSPHWPWMTFWDGRYHSLLKKS